MFSSYYIIALTGKVLNYLNKSDIHAWKKKTNLDSGIRKLATRF